MSKDDLRASFAEASARHFREPLLGRYRVAFVDHATWKASYDPVEAELFVGHTPLESARIWTEEERARFTELNAIFGTPLQQNALVTDGETSETIAWFHGFQEGRAIWYMGISAVHPAWRGRGVYTAFLERLLGLLREQGFREVSSRHKADNNAILVPKLRAGFTIGAFEITVNHGLLVHLRYCFSETLRAAYAWRVDPMRGVEDLRAKGILP